MVKVALRHTSVVLYMHTVVWHMHDVCTILNRQNSVHGHLKLLVVKWFELNVTVRVNRLGTGNGTLTSSMRVGLVGAK